MVKRANKNNSNKLLAIYSGIGAEIGLTLGGLTYGGKQLDNYYGTFPKFTLLGVFLAIIINGLFVKRMLDLSKKIMTSTTIQDEPKIVTPVEKKEYDGEIDPLTKRSI